MWSNSQVNQEWWPHMEVVFCFKYAANYNTEMEGCLHKNDPLKINIKLVRASSRCELS